MHFTTLIPILFTLASTTPLHPRAESSNFGYWDFAASVSFPASGYTSKDVSATYHNADLPSPIPYHCNFLYNPADKTETKKCDPDNESFEWDLGGVSMARTVTNVSLKQTVGLWGEQVTVFGGRELEWDFSGGSGRSGDTEGRVEVSSAIA